jgi:hypothetical protein
VLNWVGMCTDVIASGPAAEHDSDTLLNVSMREPL